MNFFTAENAEGAEAIRIKIPIGFDIRFLHL